MQRRDWAGFILATVVAATLFGPPITAAQTGPSLRIDDLRCEYLKNPLGIDAKSPRLSWKLQPVHPEPRGLVQSAYQVLVATSESLLSDGKGTLWDSGRVMSDQSIHVPFAGHPLTSHTECWWKVRVWDQNGNESPWSAPAHWSMGLLDPQDWKARWIGLDGGEETDNELEVLRVASWIWFPGGKAAVGAPIGTRYFRRTVDVPAGRRVRLARFLATADDSFVASMNGHAIGRGASWAEVKLFDITADLRPGRNVLGVAASNSPSTTVSPDRNPAGLIGLLKVEFEQGEPLLVPTDATWRVSATEIAGWDRDDAAAGAWKEPELIGSLGVAPWGKIGGSNHRRLPSRMLRHEFKVRQNIERATAYVCGLGFFDLEMNGQAVSDQLMNPALTGYDRRALYVTFDVTRQLRTGDNAVGVTLGNGRYFAPRRDVPVPMNTYGFPKLLFQMRIEYQDGTVDHVLSDSDWRLTTNGPIRSDNEFDGEEYDARREMPGWSSPHFDDTAWQSVSLVAGPRRPARGAGHGADPDHGGAAPDSHHQPAVRHLHGRFRPVVLWLGATQGVRTRRHGSPYENVVQRHP